MDPAIAILKGARRIAVVGLSDKPERPSYDVASYLMGHGYTIIPVNPNMSQWKGIRAYPSLTAAADDGQRIDCVDIFRRSSEVAPIVDEAIRIKARYVWMQLGVLDEASARRATEAGLVVVMDRCMKIEHMRMVGGTDG